MATHEAKDNIEHLLTKFWETEVVPEMKSEVTVKQNSCEAEFQRSVQLIDNKFQVSLPLAQPMDQLNLGNTFPIAFKTLNCIEKRFKKDQKLHERYKEFINKYIELGHAKVLPLTNSNKQQLYFMQHLPVIREDRKTNKVRVVFNGNTKAGKEYNSLNDVLLNGPKVQKDLFDILISFRVHKYVMMADIQNMYRAIRIDPKFHHLQNILWHNNNNELIIIQLQTVTYGQKSSSFLATRCLEELAVRYEAELPKAAEVIRTAMYVDDALFGADSIKDALEVRDQFTNLLSHADFHLHKWAANDPKLLTGISPESCYADDHQLSMKTDLKALGMVFNPNQDVFKINYPNKEIQHWDKRSILSFIGSFFDPLGLAGPIVVRAKQFLQDLWRQNLDWTSPIPEEFLSKWIKFHKEILEMPTIQIQRHVMPTKDQVEIIGFCDASSKSYGACIYVRTFQNGKATMNLLCSKSKIAPMKNELTIPKLELNAAVLLAKLLIR